MKQQIPQAPEHLLQTDGFWASIQDNDLVYFCLNVGDGDAQVLLLPVIEEKTIDGTGAQQITKRRPIVIVDAGSASKPTKFLESLPGLSNGVVPSLDVIDLVVATHPHSDHISGIPKILETFGPHIAEFWDPGYFHPSGTYHAVMELLHRHNHITYAQPASGLRRFIGDTEISVVTPSIHLRNRYDSYGVDVNNASITLRVATPAGRSVLTEGGWELMEGVNETTQFSLLLGGDAQTDSWSHAIVDFPALVKSQSEAAKAIGAATRDRDFLRADVLKVSHHGSKKGVNYELVTRMRPTWMIVSCGGNSVHGFPHELNQHILREAKKPLAKSGKVHDPADDHTRGVFYTAQDDTNGVPLGSIAMVGSRTSDITMWRFGDKPASAIDFTTARRWTTKPDRAP